MRNGWPFKDRGRGLSRRCLLRPGRLLVAAAVAIGSAGLACREKPERKPAEKTSPQRGHVAESPRTPPGATGRTDAATRSGAVEGGDAPTSTGPSGPNVLLIVLDTTRADFFSCYGFPLPTTPTMDKLAGEGTRYESAYATDFWTLPSHASLFTGMYPSEVGATAETNHLPAEAVTLAERLRAHGYQTGAIACNPWVSRARGFAQGFSDYLEMWRRKTSPGASPRPLGQARIDEVAVKEAAAWMRRRAGTGAPFFLFINLNVPHMPYDPPPALRREFATQQWPEARMRRLTKLSGMWRHLAGALPLDATDFTIMRELYAAEVALTDRHVKTLIDTLDALSILDDTLVIVTSDHGENIGDHGMIDHLLSMYETTLRIPLIIRYPRRFRAEVDSTLVSLVDVFPTVMDICGIAGEPAPADATRVSLCRADRPRRLFVTAENERPINGIKILKKRFPSFDTSTIDHRMRMLRTERYKVIWRENARTEVYDLQADPLETRDLSRDRPELRDGLVAELRSWMDGLRSGHRGEAFESNDAETLERLRSLGYIE